MGNEVIGEERISLVNPGINQFGDRLMIFVVCLAVESIQFLTFNRLADVETDSSFKLQEASEYAVKILTRLLCSPVPAGGNSPGSS